MILSRLLRESEDKHESARNIYSDTHDILTKLAQTTSQGGVIGEELQTVLDHFKSKSPKKKEEETSQISLTFPTKTVATSESENHHRKLTESLKFKQDYEEWNDKLYQAYNSAPTTDGAEGGLAPPGTSALPTQRRTDEDVIHITNRVRLPDSKPWYITPPDTVIKIGDTHYEMKVEKVFNPERGHDEWEKVGLEILERPSGNKVDQEDACVLMDPTNKKIVDWEATLNRIKRLGERLGYSRSHFLECITRLLNEHEPEKYDIFKEETDPNKLVHTLLAKYKALNKRKIIENKIKGLKRGKDQSLLEVMSQVDALADKMLERCKDAKEKDYRKYTIMLDATKAFTSEKNAVELSKFLREASLKGERPKITTIVEMVDQAERIDESTKPNKEMCYEQTITSSNSAELFTFGVQERERRGDYRPNQRERSAESRKTIQGITDTLSKMRVSENEKKTQERRGRDSSRDLERSRNDKSFSRERRGSIERRSGRQDNYKPQYRQRTPERFNRQRSSDRYNDRHSDRHRDRDNYRERERNTIERGRDSAREKDRDRYRGRSSERNREVESHRSRSQSRDNRQGYYDRYTRNGSRDNYRSSYNRESSRSRRDLGSREREKRRDSRDRFSQKASVPLHKKNLAGVEFPPLSQMDLSTKFCIKCNNIIEPHYPWDCKLFRYWNSNPCEICYNGNHRSKECRKNPARVDAYYAMVQDQASVNQNNTEPQAPYFTPSN